jgi:hypothetical protein
MPNEYVFIIVSANLAVTVVLGISAIKISLHFCFRAVYDLPTWGLAKSALHVFALPFFASNTQKPSSILVANNIHVPGQRSYLSRLYP